MKEVLFPPFLLRFCATLSLLGCISCAGEKPKNLAVYSVENSSLSSDKQTVIATLKSNSRPLAENFMCFNVNSVRVESWHKSQFQQAVNKLNPRMLRLPGGDVANYWNWQRGGIIENISNLTGDLPWFLRFKARQYTGGKL